MGKTAILLGASGATGSEVLTLLLKDSRYDKIRLFSRSSSNNKHPKIEEYIINLFELENCQNNFMGDEVYCCIGTTKAKTPDNETYHKIDYGIPVVAAKLAKENNIKTFVVISAIGADAGSSVFYSRTKGQMQEGVLKAGIPKTYILQPSLILAERNEMRLVERVASGIMWLINPLLFGNAARFKSITAKNIAKAMVWLCNNTYPNSIVQSNNIKEIADKE